MTGKGNMLKFVSSQKLDTSKGNIDCSNCNQNRQLIEFKNKQIESLERQIASFESNMQMILASKDQMLSMKDQLLKSKDEVIKKNEENHKLVIAQYQAEIKKLEEKEDFFNQTEIPVIQSVTVEQEGAATVLKQVKKISSPSLSKQTPNAPLGK